MLPLKPILDIGSPEQVKLATTSSLDDVTAKALLLPFTVMLPEVIVPAKVVLLPETVIGALPKVSESVTELGSFP